MWYKVIYDMLPTNERLHTIKLSNSAQCRKCGDKDTIMHRLTDCGTGNVIWEWTKKRIACILHMDPSHIPKEWILRPQFHIWPPQRRGAILWILVHMVWFRMRESPTPSAKEYSDFLQRARCKAYQSTGRRHQVGKYLGVL
jgi:hypothetical protein